MTTCFGPRGTVFLPQKPYLTDGTLREQVAAASTVFIMQGWVPIQRLLTNVFFLTGDLPAEGYLPRIRYQTSSIIMGPEILTIFTIYAAAAGTR